MQWNSKLSFDFYKELLADLTFVSEADVPSILKDHGDRQDFKVLQLGGGECAGVSKEDVAANFSEAANERVYMRSFILARKYAQAVESAEAIARLVGQSLLHSIGQDAKLTALTAIIDKLKQHLPEQPSFYDPLSTFATELHKFELAASTSNDETAHFDIGAFNYFLEMLNAWTVLTGHFCQQKNLTVDLLGFLPETNLMDSTTRKYASSTTQGNLTDVENILMNPLTKPNTESVTPSTTGV